jgi:prepilin-type processing-associated H-X9-DG protein
MEHGFPPGATIEDVHATWLFHHSIMLSLVVATSGCHFLPKKRLSQPETLWLWSIILTFSAAITILTWVSLSSEWIRLGGSAMNPETLAAYMLLCWSVGFAGSIRTLRGTKRISKHSRLASFHAYFNVLCPIIGLFVASVLIPVMSVRGESSFQWACRNNLRSIGRALEPYLESNKSYPQATTGSPPTSWRIRLLPFLYGGTHSAEYDPQSPWDSERNLEVSKFIPSSFTCSSSGQTHPGNTQRCDDQNRCFTDFPMLTGPGTFSSDFKPITPQGISDEASNTIAFVEAAGLRIVWTEPRDARVGREPLGINLTGSGEYDSPGIMSAWHTGGAHAVFADGSVRFVSQDIDPQVLKALTTVNGGESLPDSY